MMVRFRFGRETSSTAIGSVPKIAGAIAAQRITDQGRRKAELLKELRATNMAITNAAIAANLAFAEKNQLIKP